MERITSTCTCDDFCDSPCPMHGRESELQNDVIELKNDVVVLQKKVFKLQRKLSDLRTGIRKALSYSGPPAVARDMLRRLVDRGV